MSIGKVSMSQRSRRVSTDSRTVAYNTLWNLLGRVGPALVALLVTPQLILILGPERWGVFTLSLGLTGIFGILDFGIGRALTRLVAERVGAGNGDDAAPIVMTGILVLTGFGVAGGLLLAGAAGLWVQGSLNIPPALHGQVLASMYIICASAPVMVLGAAFWGVIAAYQRFRIINLIQLPISAMYYLAPLLVLKVWDSLVGATMALLVCRLAITVACGCVSFHVMPVLRRARPDWHGVGKLLGTGGWMTVSNLSGPVLMFMDRFLIASIVSATAAGYYATPFDVVCRLNILTTAVLSSAYPAMAASFRMNAANTVALFRHSIIAVCSMLLPACLIVVAYSTPLLTIWVNAEFAANAAAVFRWLGLGILVWSIDTVVYCLLDSIGRPDVNAKLSLAEIALSIPLVVALLHAFGIEGAAIALVIRLGADLVVRLCIAVSLYPPLGPSMRVLVPTMIAGIGSLGLPLMADGIVARLMVICVALLGFFAIVWRSSLTSDERLRLRERARSLTGSRRLLRVDPEHEAVAGMETDP